MTSFIDAYKVESSRGSNTLDTMYKIGKASDKIGTRIITPKLGFTVNEIKSATSRNLDLSAGNYPLEALPISMLPVNGLMYWHTFGSASDQTTFKRIAPLATGRKPSFSIYTEEFPNTDKYEAKGLVVQSLDEQIQEGGQLKQVISCMGMSHGISSATPTVSAYIGSVESIFDKLVSTDAFIWNSNPLLIKSITRKTLNTLTPVLGEDGYYTEITENDVIRTAWTVVFAENQDLSDLISDANPAGPTQRAMSGKIYKSADPTQYIDFSTADAYCYNLMKTRIQGQPTRYVGMFIGESSQIDINDGINKSNYGL